MKKVLILAYYFPPMGLSGVQRTLKFVKYLPDFGWEPTVLTVEPHAYFAFDYSFEKEIENRPVKVWRCLPGKAFRAVRNPKTVSMKHEHLRFIFNRLSQLFFIPDNKKGWMHSALDFLSGKDMASFDLIFSTAPPFTSHLIAARLKALYGKPAVIDFRDPWLENPYHIYWTPWHKKAHRALEQTAIQAADAVVLINDGIRNLLKARYTEPDLSHKMHIVEHGYDAEDFSVTSSDASVTVNNDRVNFVYCGVFYDMNTPAPLYRALALIKEKHPEIYACLAFYMVGYVQIHYRKQARMLGVEDRFIYTGYLEHPQAVAWLKAADVLWLTLGVSRKGHQNPFAGKAFEYLGSQKPILAILPDNSLKKMLEGFEHVVMAHPDHTEAIASAIMDLAKRKALHQLPVGDIEKIRLYDRKLLTGKLAAIFDFVVKK